MISLFFRKCRWLILSVLIFLLLQNAILSAADEVWPRLETRHFLLVAEPMLQPATMSLSDWDAALTQHIAQLDDRLAPLFGERTLSQMQTTLGQKPILLICADKSSYHKKLVEYGVVPSDGAMIGSGGFYHPESNVIFVWRQPTDYYARHVVLHEVVHWYCLQLLGERYGKMPLWLCEGLADFAASHTWDSQILHTMRMPRVSLENYPARLDALLKRLVPDGNANDISPESITRIFEQLRNDPDSEKNMLVYDEYALAWGLVTYLIDKHSDEMKRLCEQLAQHDMTQSWPLAFDESQNCNWRCFADWVSENQLPWQWVWNHWEDDGRQLVGISDSMALTVQNPACQNLQTDVLCCKVTMLLEGTVIGLVFCYESSDNFEMIQFRMTDGNNAIWRHIRFAQKKWQALTPWQKIVSTPQGDNPGHDPTLELRRQMTDDNETISVLFDSRLVAKFADTAKGLPFGLTVQSGAAQFQLQTR